MRERLSPHVRALLEAIDAEGLPPMEELSPREARQAALDGNRKTGGEPEPVALVEDIRIAGPAGMIPLRIYTPEGKAPNPALIYFHGGGWVVCNLDTHDVVCRALARRSGAVVVSVDYRLAPEHKFPAAVEDCYAATLWVAQNAERLGIRLDRIAVGGDSAGGNLAAVIARKCRDEQGPPLAMQILVYPVTNLASTSTPSYEEFADGYFLTRAAMQWFRDHYLARPADAEDPSASPLLAVNLGGLPPALVLTAECDVLRDEGEAYAKRLEQAGVRVSMIRCPATIHAFFTMQGVLPEGPQAVDLVAGALRIPQAGPAGSPGPS